MRVWAGGRGTRQAQRRRGNYRESRVGTAWAPRVRRVGAARELRRAVKSALESAGKGAAMAR